MYTICYQQYTFKDLFSTSIFTPAALLVLAQNHLMSTDEKDDRSSLRLSVFPGPTLAACPPAPDG